MTDAIALRNEGNTHSEQIMLALSIKFDVTIIELSKMAGEVVKFSANRARPVDSGIIERAIIALGANLSGADGSPPAVLLTRALGRLAGLAPLVAVSRFWRTPAFPAGAGPDYVNTCAALDWAGTADALLAALHVIEADLGRDRDGVARWASRVIDLDLLALGGQIHPDPATEAAWRRLPPEARGATAPDRLILPHPRMTERGFVLVPLAEIAPGWRHPATGHSVAQMLAHLPAAELAEIQPI